MQILANRTHIVGTLERKLGNIDLALEIIVASRDAANVDGRDGIVDELILDRDRVKTLHEKLPGEHGRRLRRSLRLRQRRGQHARVEFG